MNLLILNGNKPYPEGRNPAYRGTYRTIPTFCKTFPEDHEVNKLFMWYLEEGGETGVVHDLHKALRYAQLLNLADPSRHFEVVEVVGGQCEPFVAAERIFLGFDISEGFCNSLLQWGLDQDSGYVQLSEWIRERANQVSQLYGPKLNKSGLFNDYNVALTCLESMIDVQNYYPAFYEGGDLKRFNIVGVHLVRGAE